MMPNAIGQGWVPARLCLLVKEVNLSGIWNPQQSDMAPGTDVWQEEGILPTALLDWIGLFLAVLTRDSWLQWQ